MIDRFAGVGTWEYQTIDVQFVCDRRPSWQSAYADACAKSPTVRTGRSDSDSRLNP